MINPKNLKCRHRMVIPTYPIVLIKGDRRRKVDNGTMPCTNADMTAELEHQSQTMVSDRSCVLHIGDKTVHLIDANEKVIPLTPMEVN